MQPEQIFYSPDNETIDGKAPDKEALLRQALVGAGFLDGDGKSNMKGIGPTFTHIYEVQQVLCKEYCSYVQYSLGCLAQMLSRNGLPATSN